MVPLAKRNSREMTLMRQTLVCALCYRSSNSWANRPIKEAAEALLTKIDLSTEIVGRTLGWCWTGSLQKNSRSQGMGEPDRMDLVGLVWVAHPPIASAVVVEGEEVDGEFLPSLGSALDCPICLFLVTS